MKWIVYKHTSPSGNTYIGITSCSPCQRWCRGAGYKKNTAFYNAIKKYGWDNIDHKVLISNLTVEQACEVEKQLIHYYKSIHKSYNITDGGEGTTGYKHTEECKYKMRLLQLGKAKSKESIEKAKETRRLHPLRHTEEAKRRIAEAARKVSHLKATEAAKIANSKAVCIVKSGTVTEMFSSKRALAKFYNISEWKVCTYSKSKKYVKEIDGFIIETKNLN